ncbi:bifunctional sugar-binding transcriptional regulator/dihydroxyacetone kinase subunit DhaK [Paracoccus seriniphilus]|uniref:Dihydroxyacetone kinase, N-terminal domain n=1 Tax=Paracoccus seriniphilus TaxID=184748 RepID=A0A239PUL1_9RHOB|nr:bifunctional sugar-binding transcriptional regulator/dihydroxyacetone kinase subunit DhaK [Paracoccus seriniphilus]WCR15494.1 bifunctional sugar-binding transcriptional regulator/dihydroxyacetone kinase subunit DhaK [Paracoccus seriniphilus]SNT73989.1 dihydroxyacetone kinase, N-terminal domain [Paracoccus seriniphilus]
MTPRRETAKAQDGVLTEMPMRFGEDPLLWAAWLYYEDGMTQGDIAKKMGLSRASVNAYLADARTRGLVNIEIEPDRFRAVSIAVALKERFDLQDCLVIPSEGGERSLTERLGAAGAQALRRVMRPGDTLAVTWGRTVLAVADALSHPGLDDLRVVQATGSTTARIPWTPETCASRIAQALHASWVPISAPAIVSDPALRRDLLNQPLLAEQVAVLAEANRILMGVSSMRPESTIHTSGFLDSADHHRDYPDAVASIVGRLVSARGAAVTGPVNDRTIGIDLEALRRIPQRIAVAGGIDKIAAILAVLRGRFANVLVTDAATARGILKADGWQESPRRPALASATPGSAQIRSHAKKLFNAPQDAVDESLAGALTAHGAIIGPVPETSRAVMALDGPREGKVGIVIGGGSGHEPGFWGYVGKGCADAAVIGNIFAAPPPGPILAASRAVNRGAGLLYIYGNFSGDVMNFDMAAEMAGAEGVEVRSVVTTDDIASSPPDARGSRRGVAGNVFVFKIAGAAADMGASLSECEAITRRAAARVYTMGLALEPARLPDTRQPSFELGPEDMELGVGVHGEPGMVRHKLVPADDAADMLLDRILQEMNPARGDKVAVLVNSLGGTPAMELYILTRRIGQRLRAKGIILHRTLVGPYYTSLDMEGVSLTLLHLDDELVTYLDHPCQSAALTITARP